MLNGAHFCSGAYHFIFRVGGYWLINLTDKVTHRIKKKFKYDMRLAVFDSRTHHWDVDSYGKMNYPRHNCAATTMGERYLYVFGGSYFQENIIKEHLQVTIER